MKKILLSILLAATVQVQADDTFTLEGEGWTPTILDPAWGGI